jgi:hypothetical protein
MIRSARCNVVHPRDTVERNIETRFRWKKSAVHKSNVFWAVTSSGWPDAYCGRKFESRPLKHHHLFHDYADVRVPEVPLADLSFWQIPIRVCWAK